MQEILAMFNKAKRIAVLEEQVATLTTRRDQLMIELDAQSEKARQARLELQERRDEVARDEKNLKHELALKEERSELAHKKKHMELEADHQRKLNELQNEFHGQAQRMLIESKKDLMEQYNALMERLPDVNLALKGRVGNEG
jgi:hypothetical protein